MVQGVECFETQLQEDPLGEVKVLLERGVENVDSGGGDNSYGRSCYQVPFGCSAKAAVLNHSPVEGFCEFHGLTGNDTRGDRVARRYWTGLHRPIC